MFCLDMEGLESEVSHWVGGHSTLGPVNLQSFFRVSLRFWGQSVACSLQDLMGGMGVWSNPLVVTVN